MITEKDLKQIGLDPKIVIGIYDRAIELTRSNREACKAIEYFALAGGDELPFSFGELHQWAKQNSKAKKLQTVVFGVAVHDGYLCQDCFIFHKGELTHARTEEAKEMIDCKKCGQWVDYIIFTIY